MDPLEVGMVGCGLDSGGDAKMGNPRQLVVAVATAEARMQGMEPWG